MPVSPVAVIGAGPAGLAAALQLARYALPPLLLEAERVGGLLWNANWVENYPGFPNGLSGAQLAGLFQQHLVQAQIEPTAGRALTLRFHDDRFELETESRVYLSSYVVVASGTQPVRLEGVEMTAEARERVYYEVSRLPPGRGRCVAILGAGDAAFDYALNLASQNEVILLNRGERVKCLPLLWRRAEAVSHIRYLPRVRLHALRLSDTRRLLALYERDGTEETLQADYLLCALGRTPQRTFMTELAANEIERLQAVGRLYFAGDVQNGDYRQTAIAVGDGIDAAMRIYRNLKEMER